MSNIIYVIGYPKSGNTWLSRLLGDALNSPIKGVGKSKALADEGYDRPGGYIIRQLHLRNMPKSPHSVVYIYRDPRDVCVSVNHYWQMNDLTKAIRRVGALDKGQDSAVKKGWLGMHQLWYYEFEPTVVTSYESLSDGTEGELKRILDEMKVEPFFELDEVVERQDFDVRRKQLEEKGNKHPYGKAVQLRNMRKGVAGDWVNHFNRDQAVLADALFGEEMLKMNYIKDRDWWEDVGE